MSCWLAGNLRISSGHSIQHDVWSFTCLCDMGYDSIFLRVLAPQVLDLDETLVHSSLEEYCSTSPTSDHNAAEIDFTFPVHFNNQEHKVRRVHGTLRFTAWWLKEAAVGACPSGLPGSF